MVMLSKIVGGKCETSADIVARRLFKSRHNDRGKVKAQGGSKASSPCKGNVGERLMAVELSC